MSQTIWPMKDRQVGSNCALCRLSQEEQFSVRNLCHNTVMWLNKREMFRVSQDKCGNLSVNIGRDV